jgi:carboxylesterase
VVDDLVPLRWEDWSGAAEAAYLALADRCDTVMVVGLSMGGTLACWLATRHPEIAGLVVINPMLEPLAPELVQAGREAVTAGIELVDGIGADIAKPGVPEVGYTQTPVSAVLSLSSAVDALAVQLGAITCPTLLFSSREDHVVPPTSGAVLESSIGGPLERVALERSFHVATLDWDAPLIEDRTVAFVGRVAGGGVPVVPGAAVGVNATDTADTASAAGPRA